MREEFLLCEEVEGNIDDDSIYLESTRERLVEDDEISLEEAGFMQGYDEAYL